MRRVVAEYSQKQIQLDVLRVQLVAAEPLGSIPWIAAGMRKAAWSSRPARLSLGPTTGDPWLSRIQMPR